MIEKPHLMSPDARLTEIGKLLAAGVLRLRARAVTASKNNPRDSCATPPDSDPKALELSGETVLSVTTG